MAPCHLYRRTKCHQTTQNWMNHLARQRDQAHPRTPTPAVSLMPCEVAGLTKDCYTSTASLPYIYKSSRQQTKQRDLQRPVRHPISSPGLSKTHSRRYSTFHLLSRLSHLHRRCLQHLTLPCHQQDHSSLRLALPPLRRVILVDARSIRALRECTTRLLGEYVRIHPQEFLCRSRKMGRNPDFNALIRRLARRSHRLPATACASSFPAPTQATETMEDKLRWQLVDN